MPEQHPPPRYATVLRVVLLGLLALVLGWFSLLMTGFGAWTSETEPSAQLAEAAVPLLLGALLGACAGVALGTAVAGPRRGVQAFCAFVGVVPTGLLVAGFFSDLL